MKMFKKRKFLLCAAFGFSIFFILLNLLFIPQPNYKYRLYNSISEKVALDTYLKETRISSPSAVFISTVNQDSENQESKIEQKEQYSGFCLNAPVLMYHHIQPYSEAQKKLQTSLSVDNIIFDQQMAYLVSNGYSTITAKQLVDAVKTHSPLPSKSIVITLDDGYKDAHTYAYPILQKYHLTANMMISTGLVGGEDYLSWEQIGEMSRSGLVYFTDHTWSHYSLGNASSDKITFEIMTAKQQLEDHTGQKVDIFTYPYGSFSNLVVSILQQNGFIGAFSTIPGFYQCDSFIMDLHRIRIGNASLSAYGL